MNFNLLLYLFFFTVVVIMIILPILIPALVIAYLLLEWYNKRKNVSKPLHKQAYDAFVLSQYLGAKRDYITNSPTWKEKRKERFIEAQGLCECCGEPLDISDFHAHHISGYMDIPYESISDIRVMHPDCHSYQHEILGYPETLEDYEQWNVKIQTKDKEATINYGFDSPATTGNRSI